MQIKKTELKNKYGIDLTEGKYRIIKEGNRYKISTVKDDTEGCILVGKKEKDGLLINSRDTLNYIVNNLSMNKPITLDVQLGYY